LIIPAASEIKKKWANSQKLQNFQKTKEIKGIVRNLAKSCQNYIKKKKEIQEIQDEDAT